MAILSRDYAVIQSSIFPGELSQWDFSVMRLLLIDIQKANSLALAHPVKLVLTYQEHILSLFLVFALPSQVCIIWCSTALECFRRMVAKWGKTLWRPVLPPTLKITEEPTVNVYFS